MKAFEQQVLDVLPRMRRHARNLCRDAQEAEDLIHDSLEKAFAGRAGWRGENLQAWLMAVMSNTYKNRLRSQGRRPETVPIDEHSDLSIDHSAGDPLERKRLMQAVRRLHHDQRAVLMLVAVEGYRYGEAARMLDVPVGTVMSRLSRARRNLAAFLAGDNIVDIRRNR